MAGFDEQQDRVFLGYTSTGFMQNYELSEELLRNKSYRENGTLAFDCISV
jgi:hypothetical protein